MSVGMIFELSLCLVCTRVAIADDKTPAVQSSLPVKVLALKNPLIKQIGNWREDRFRFAALAAVQTGEDQATLEYAFDGTAIAVRLGGHNVPAYGPPNLGSLLVSIDGGKPRLLNPRALPREIVIANDLSPGQHKLRLEHRQDGELTGCRVESFLTWSDRRGELSFHVSGEENTHLVDCRALLRRAGKIVRNTLVRNWLTGQCSLVGLPCGDQYTLEIQAMGWLTAHSKEFSITAGQPTHLAPIYLKRHASTVAHRFRFPKLNQPAIRKPSETFRARFLGFDASIDEVRLTRHAGPATISRVLDFSEDQTAAYYYDREIIASLPNDMPAGAYDLTVKVTGGRRTGFCRSPRSVHVVAKYPRDPVFVTFGHLDTSAQYQAEYLERLVKITNLLAPDMLLCSNACNPAYVSGALTGLKMPSVVNFGNHQFSGHEAWYGDPVGLIDCGPAVSVLNFGYPWHTDKSKARALLASRPDTAIRVINAFEANAPFSLLDSYQVRMIHDAHGIGKKVKDIGATPTRRIGKSNSESFRVVRFRNNQVDSCTYRGHETDPIPLPREAASPLSLTYLHSNDGTHSENTATVTNRLTEAYPNGRVTFVVPPGKYDIKGGRLESQILSDDGRFCLLDVRLDIPSNRSTQISVARNP